MLANEYITDDEYKRALLEPIELVEDIPLLEERTRPPTSSTT